MEDLNLTPKFKYRTLICCQVRNIFSLYGPTGAISVHGNHQHSQGWNPTTRKKIKMKINSFFSKIKKSNLMRITINMLFLKRCPVLICFQYHTPQTIYHATTDWIQYRINLVQLSTVQILIENQSHYKWSARP